ncbi:MAG: hypothetical protein ACLVKR_04390 [Lachnospiraceae bacterium]
MDQSLSIRLLTFRSAARLLLQLRCANGVVITTSHNPPGTTGIRCMARTEDRLRRKTRRRYPHLSIK